MGTQGEALWYGPLDITKLRSTCSSLWLTSLLYTGVTFGLVSPLISRPQNSEVVVSN
jgi:hypothetical protein